MIPVPAGVTVWLASGQTDKATEAAKSGCDATAKMKPRLGRASYLGGRAVGIPDAGAAAVVCWMEAIAKAMR
jgi:DAK2 domain